MSDVAFELPNDVESILDDLRLDLDPQTRRRVFSAVAKLVENNRALEARLSSSPFGYLPTLEEDPAAPADGQTWINTTDSAVRTWFNGAPHEFTIT